MSKDFINSWDTTITLDSSGNGSAQLIDNYNSLVVLQIITSPSTAQLKYTIDVLNQDFNLVTFTRSVQGALNEFLNLPMVGRNLLRIRGAVPAEGNVVVAVRHK